MAGDHHTIEKEVIKGEVKAAAAAAANHGGGSHGKIPYPRHVWSPAGGWYSQPVNWKANTAVAALVGVAVVGAAFLVSAEREHRTKFPEPGRFFPSRNWSRQIIEHEKQQASKSS